MDVVSPKVCQLMFTSLLPKLDISNSVFFLNGDETGITFIKMNNKLDEGDCIDKYEMQGDDHNKVTLEEDLCI